MFYQSCNFSCGIELLFLGRNSIQVSPLFFNKNSKFPILLIAFFASKCKENADNNVICNNRFNELVMIYSKSKCIQIHHIATASNRSLLGI